MKMSYILLQNADACLSSTPTVLSGIQAYNNRDYGK